MPPIVIVLTLCAISFVGSKGYRVAATLFAVDMGAGPLQTGIIFALWGLFPFLLSVYAGRLADRFDNRVLMYCGLAGFTTSLALPFLLPSMAALYASAALGGFTSMLFVVATQNLVGLLSTSQTRTRNFSYYSLGESSAAIGGPIVVGLCIDHMSHRTTFLLLACVVATCLLMLFVLHKRIPELRVKEEKKAGLNARDLFALPALRKALLANAAVMTGLDLFNLYMPVYTRSLGLTATTIGFVMAAFGVAGFVTRVALPRLTGRWGEHATMSRALALSTCAFLMVPVTQQPALLAATAFMLGLGLGCGQPLTMILSFNAAPAGRSAEAIAMRLAVSYGAHVVIPPVFGVIGAATGLAPIFWTCAMLLAGGAAITKPAKTPPA